MQKPSTRQGIAKTITFDFDAATILDTMIPQRHQGRILSELIREEAKRRADRPRLLATLAAQRVLMEEQEAVAALAAPVSDE